MLHHAAGTVLQGRLVSRRSAAVGMTAKWVQD